MAETERRAGADLVLGIQWGDEGKGRVIDALAAEYDVVARFGGGDNAGHTLVVGERRLALRIVPSGALHPRPELFIGGGTVVNLPGLVAELALLKTLGIDLERIKISDRAHIVFAYHEALDREHERARGEAALGTTGRGIGPAYADRSARIGLTFADLRNPQTFAERIARNLAFYRSLNESSGGHAALFSSLSAQTLALAPHVLPHVVDGVAYLHERLEAGKRILIEGAQGTLLDIGYGTYPYVTSSHTIAGGACTGLGIGPHAIASVLGVAKAYATRVGAGPFPSELEGERAERLRARGGEFGTVTGRPRRCGWFDAVAGRYAVRLNGLDRIVLTKLDVLSGFERIALAVGYRLGASAVEFAAAGEPELALDLRWFDGWREELGEIRSLAALPLNARRYVEAIEQLLGVPVEAVSVGPERAQIAR